MNPKLSNFVAVDLGSSKIACIAAYIEKKGDTRIVSQNLHYSQGLKSGAIVDLKTAETSIVEAIYNLEKNCGKNVKKVAASLSGAGTKSYYVRQKIRLSNQAISINDIKKLIHKALLEFKIKDQEIIHYFVVEFTLDNNVIENPTGMFGKELGCELHIIAAYSNMISNIINCFAKCHIEVKEIILAIYASGIACLSQDEQKLGSLIIDIGDKTTSLGIFLAGKLIYTDYIDIGSFHIHSDIAKIFGLDFAIAEKLKILYGNATLSSIEKDSIINMDEFLDYSYNLLTPITINKLAEIISPRAEEILSMVKIKYDKVVEGQMIAYRVIITGGGSKLRGLKELAERVFEKQVRIGKPEIIDGFAEDYNPAIYSTAIGIVKIQSLKQQKELFHVKLEENSTFLRKCFIWLKENI